MSTVSRSRADSGSKAISGEPPAVSIVIPLLNEEETLPLLHERLRAAVEGLGRSCEIVYVDDGSTDATFERLTAIVQADPQVRIVQFRRNFGQTAALQAGIDYSQGEALVFMDGDLQNDPAASLRQVEVRSFPDAARAAGPDDGEVPG